MYGRARSGGSGSQPVDPAAEPPADDTILRALFSVRIWGRRFGGTGVLHPGMEGACLDHAICVAGSCGSDRIFVAATHIEGGLQRPGVVLGHVADHVDRSRSATPSHNLSADGRPDFPFNGSINDNHDSGFGQREAIEFGLSNHSRCVVLSADF